MITPFQIGIRIDPFAALAIKKRAGDLTPILSTFVDDAVTDFTEKQFDTEGSYGGQPWAPLAPLTIILRARPGHGLGGIGVDTTRMWSSLITRGGESVVNIGPQFYSRGTIVPYARWFVEGRPGQPARPIWPIPLPQFLVTQVANIISYWVATGRESSGRRGDTRAQVTIGG